MFKNRSVSQIQPESHQLVTFVLEVQRKKKEDENRGGGRGQRKKKGEKLNVKRAEGSRALERCERP